ncbi:uncharacterized protein SOCEGT47_031320 [Sorangium cellulosum]|uniref:Uncharacterized protein n=1 Tax=Sorangium cellulosum TaxID=56 RepID=A0A4P2Q115_SORCE|nr:uncharacterized protein SOCEGT47_031320 [Sorangium cellulosum]
MLSGEPARSSRRRAHGKDRSSARDPLRTPGGRPLAQTRSVTDPRRTAPRADAIRCGPPADGPSRRRDPLRTPGGRPLAQTRSVADPRRAAPPNGCTPLDPRRAAPSQRLHSAGPPAGGPLPTVALRWTPAGGPLPTVALPLRWTPGGRPPPNGCTPLDPRRAAPSQRLHSAGPPAGGPPNGCTPLAPLASTSATDALRRGPRQPALPAAPLRPAPLLPSPSDGSRSAPAPPPRSYKDMGGLSPRPRVEGQPRRADGPCHRGASRPGRSPAGTPFLALCRASRQISRCHAQHAADEVPPEGRTSVSQDGPTSDPKEHATRTGSAAEGRDA